MNPKTYKFYKGIFDLARTDYYSDTAAVTAFIRNSLDFDYDIAVELWDFLATDAIDCGAPQKEAAAALGEAVLIQMQKKNAGRTLRSIVEKDTIAFLLYGFPEKPCDAARDILLRLIMGGKFEDADVIFSAFQKSRNYGAAMRELVEQLFEEIRKKTGSVKVTMPKKNAEFLRGHIQKIKGPEKALLDQRIKEIL